MQPRALTLALIALLTAPLIAHGASFHVLRNVYVPFPSGGVLSADGRVVAGFAVPGDWIWTADNAASGALPLGTYHNFPLPTEVLQGHNVAAISGDGSVIVGGGPSGGFRFSIQDGFEPMTSPPIDNLRVEPVISDMTPDGSTMVGIAELYSGLTQSSFVRRNVYRWTRDTGIELLTALPTGGPVRISDDGSTIVGMTVDGPYRWTAATGVEVLGVPPFLLQNFLSLADISGDGSTIVGSGSRVPPFPDHHTLAFRWTRESGYEQLGPLDAPSNPLDSTIAVKSSRDGSIIIGTNGGRDYAWYWDQAHGIRPLEDIAFELGIDLRGNRLANVTDMSANGKVILGEVAGEFGSAFILDLTPVPEPAGYALAAPAIAAFVAAFRKRLRL